MDSGLKSPEGLNVAGVPISKTANSPSCWLETSVPHHTDFFHDMRAGFPQSEWSKMKTSQDGSSHAFYNLVSEVSPHYFYIILLEAMSLNLAHNQVEDKVKFYPFNREVAKDLWTPFKTTTIDRLILKFIWKCLKPRI